ncbi:MAG: hypothetical protein IJ689_02105 [Alphaproteobacteria bacterium]|nr:hypothetical protein [Alphaproteobacteria bacterium]
MVKFDFRKNNDSPQHLGMRRSYDDRDRRYQRIQSAKPKSKSLEEKSESAPVENREQESPSLANVAGIGSADKENKSFAERQEEISLEIDRLWSAYRASFSVEDEKKLNSYADKYGIRLATYNEVVKDVRSEVARIAFDGGVDCPRNGFSLAYKLACDNPLKNTPHTAEQYNLQDSSVWRVMEQFPEFSSIKGRVIQALVDSRIPPEILPSMKINDFKHLMFRHCSIGGAIAHAKIFPQFDGEGKVVRDLRTQKTLTTCAKQQNTIRFINEHPEFYDVMMKIPGAREDYVKELVNQMKKGLTDMTPFLSKHPEWKDQTAINIHHIINIKDVRLLEAKGLPLSYINSYENMCVMGCGTVAQALEHKITNKGRLQGAHGIMHNNDTTFRNNAVYKSKWGQYEPPTENSIIARMEPKPGVCCMLALGDEYTIVDQQRLARAQNLEQTQSLSAGR